MIPIDIEKRKFHPNRSKLINNNRKSRFVECSLLLLSLPFYIQNSILLDEKRIEYSERERERVIATNISVGVRRIKLKKNRFEKQWQTG